MHIGRWLKHAFTTPGAVRRAFPEATLARIRDAVTASEQAHGGEIRFAVEGNLPWSYLRRDAPTRQRATMIFSKLRVWDTELNNGVLIYVALADHGIEIVADRAIANRIRPEEWQTIIDTMSAAFAAGRFEAGAVAAIEAVGTLLARHFPPRGRDDINELPNTPAVL
ncbi:MAG: TPM domain-containing protein [Burkholderiaceae bacterium]